MTLSKADREAYLEETLGIGLALQIRACRLKRGWTQAELARRCGMVQESISKLECGHTGTASKRTLERIASALDVGLIMRFAPWSELLARGIVTDVPAFAEDAALEAPSGPPGAPEGE